MLLLQVLWALCQFLLSTLAQLRLGLTGLILLSAIFVGIRARHNGLAVGAAVVFTLLMTQA
ncbi:hypothetical protein ACKI1I_41125 [Streptomyces turgidiscabies]|uniref:Uncharacterized protein n=1 Tax=Streptomyces turgidiscabies (strain Car8) TaxID=698760 RepID=L7FBS2_STRT8|nr:MULTISPECIES: hypothetical protein [Streptomyces]ELP68090.1 hypothetical protein STRTUCAR8_06022 [Streptomyces turgidiscabies Car8]MDX3492886.1 hypothetical protein [Streptomyces turgidiscabies]GAQ74257.1 hypothetical protein T45_06029 [Streptomyces turgidiscabies]